LVWILHQDIAVYFIRILHCDTTLDAALTMCSSDLSVRMQSGREEEEEEFMGLDQNNSKIIIPRELIRNLNMTEGGSRVCVHSIPICHGTGPP